MVSAIYEPTAIEQIAIEPAVSLADWEEARGLVREYFVWMLTTMGKDAFAAQPSTGMELLRLPRIYGAPEGKLFIARLNDEASGVAALRFLPDGVAELKCVYVTEPARGYGLASGLVDAAIEEARRAGARRMVLETHKAEMRVAMMMYQRRGFREIPAYSDLPNKVEGTVSMGMMLPQPVNQRGGVRALPYRPAATPSLVR